MVTWSYTESVKWKIKVLKIKWRWGLRNCSLFGLQLSCSVLGHGILCVTGFSPCPSISQSKLYNFPLPFGCCNRGKNERQRKRSCFMSHALGKGEEDVVKTMCLLTSCRCTCMSYQTLEEESCRILHTSSFSSYVKWGNGITNKAFYPALNSPAPGTAAARGWYLRRSLLKRMPSVMPLLLNSLAQTEQIDSRQCCISFKEQHASCLSRDYPGWTFIASTWPAPLTSSQENVTLITPVCLLHVSMSTNGELILIKVSL